MSIPRLAFTPLPRPSHSLLQRLRHPAPTSLAPHRSFTSASPIRFRGSTITGAGATARASSLSPEQESALSEWTKYVASVRTTQEDVADLNRARQLALCLPSPIRGGKAAGRDPVEKGGTDIWGIKEGDTMSYGASCEYGCAYFL